MEIFRLLSLVLRVDDVRSGLLIDSNRSNSRALLSNHTVSSLTYVIASHFTWFRPGLSLSNEYVGTRKVEQELH